MAETESEGHSQTPVWERWDAVLGVFVAEPQQQESALLEKIVMKACSRSSSASRQTVVVAESLKQRSLLEEMREDET